MRTQIIEGGGPKNRDKTKFDSCLRVEFLLITDCEFESRVFIKK